MKKEAYLNYPLREDDKFEKLVFSLVEKYKEDVVMLDALSQWSNNPTSYSAGYGVAENYEYIRSNLAVRYPNLDRERLSTVLNQLIEECNELVQASTDIYMWRDLIEKALKKSVGEKIRSEVRNKIRTLGSFEKRVVCAVLKQKPWMISEYWRISSHNKDRLLAFCEASLNTAVSELDPYSLIVKVGIFDKLLWISSSSPNRQEEYIVPEIVKPIFDEVNEYLKEEPLPDVKNYINLLVQKHQFEQLRLIDDVISSNGISYESTVEGLISVPGIIRKWKNLVAISPLVLEDLREIFQWEKASLVSNQKAETEKCLLEVRNELFPLVELNEKIYAGSNVWKFEVEGADDLWIYLAPWINRDHLNLIGNHRFNLVITTSQSLPTAMKCITQTNTSKVNVTLLCQFDRKFALRALGDKHPLLNAIIEKVRKVGYIVEERPKPTKMEQKTEELAYTTLKKLEKELRALIENKLRQHYGDDWWSAGIPKSVRKHCEKKKTRREAPYPWLSEADYSLICYAGFKDYWKITSQNENWDKIFKPIFSDAAWLMQRLKELEHIRNDIAHNREISSDDAMKLELYTREIVKAIGKTCFI
jgi:hypothetical protein